MSQPPRRLTDSLSSDDPVEGRAGQLLRSLQAPPRLPSSAVARLEEKVAAAGAHSAPRRLRLTAVALPAVAFLALLFVVRPHSQKDDGVRSRGSAFRPAATSAPELLAFRIGPDGHSQPVGDSIRRNDELAFAYRSDGGDQRLMVFARNERGRIYWYHPAWTDPADDPGAIRLAREPGVHELPAAIAQPIEGQQLEICGLFSATDLRVREAEALLARGVVRPVCRWVTVTP